MTFLDRVIAVRAAEQVEAESGPIKPVGAPEDRIDLGKHNAFLTALGLTLDDAAELAGVSRRCYRGRLYRPRPGWREHLERSMYLAPGALSA